jgi:transcriptional regulator with GAF, ATPase, and Fis domain
MDPDASHSSDSSETSDSSDVATALRPDGILLAPAADAFNALAAVVYESETLEEIYDTLVRIAVDVIDGCDHASIMRKDKDGGFQTVAATDETARIIDKLEQLHRDGPCLDAIVEDAAQFEDDLSAPDTHWPSFSREVVRLTPVRSAAGFRIIAGEEKIGALNLFSDRVGGISGRSSDQAMVLAAFASVAVSTLHHRLEARSLVQGLASNREIGKAIGLLMAFHKVSDTVAFGILRKASQDMNIKLAEVAREVVEHHNSGHSPTARV